MNEKPLTATMIVEANREYWKRKEPELRQLNIYLDDLAMRACQVIEDIMRGRVKAGWPTREDSGDIC